MDAAMCDPHLTVEQLEAIADEIASFAARIDVAKHALLTRLRVFDANEAWGPLGFSSCAAWLAWRIGIGTKTAREQVRVARALGSLTKLDELFGRGELSYSKVRAIQLPPEEAALVWDAVMSAASGCPPAEAPAEDSASPAPEASAEAPTRDEREPEQRHADAIVDVARAYLQHRPRTLGSGYELVLVTSKEQLEQAPGAPGAPGGFLRDGTPISVGVARMLACCGSKVSVTVGEHGEVLDVGRRTRVIPSAIGRALWLRDHGCRVPGCERRWHLHAHHLHEWADGGPTKLSNLVLVCPAHHRMLHEGVLDVELREGVELRDGQPRFIQATTKQELRAVPASTATGAELDGWLDGEGIELGPEVTAPRWDGTPMRLAEAIDWMLLAQSSQSSPLRSSQ